MCRKLWWRKRQERDLDEEIAYDLAAEAEENVRSGMSREQAEQSSRLDFGNAVSVKERVRDMWTFVQLEDLWRDVRHAARTLLRAPGHTGSIVLLLALGIGANAAIFSLLHAILLRELPVENAGQLVVVNRVNTQGPQRPQGISVPLFEDLRQRQTCFQGLWAAGGVTNAPVAIAAGDTPLNNVMGVIASGNYFQALGVKAAIGRVFTEDDDRFGDPQAVAVLGYDFWRGHFAAHASVLGRTLYVSGYPFAIIGVAPRRFRGHTIGQQVDFWVPLNMQPVAMPGGDRRRNRGSSWLRMMGRLRPGVSLSQAQAEASTLFAQVKAEQGESTAILLEPGSRGDGSLRQQYGKPIQILMGVAALLLLMACANVASLLLARAGMRQREIAVRQALGCGRARLMRQFFIESAILASAGAAIGLALAPWSSQALLALASSGAPLQIETSLDAKLLLFGAGVALASALAFGTAPALRASRIAIEPALRSASRGSTGSRTRQLLNRSLVAAQVTLSVVLVAGSALFARSLHRLYTTDPGFDRRQVITVTVNGRAAGYQTPEQYANLARRLTERISALPGVRSASVAAAGFLSGARRGTGNYTVDGRPYATPADPSLTYNEVSNNYLEALGLSLAAGRVFGPGDRAGTQPVAVVNEEFRRYYFSGQNPIGKRMGLAKAGPRQAIEIVGVVRDSKYNDLRENTEPLAFLPFEQFPAGFNHVLVKLDGPPAALFSAIRAAILEVDPKLRPDRLRTLDDALDRTLARDILLARLTAAFGALALLLACFGVYGVVSYLVAARTSEIGIRLAIGAQPRNVRREVVGDALKTVIPGIVVGIGLAIAAERFIESLLFGATGREPVLYVWVAACLLLTTAIAAYFPAHRASRIDPVNALRCD